ncbi:F0F1 ATP synthase subunit A [Thermithiobacillus plumbiphilus]|uniref:ATP synthase subunit a n=1 Tax=Thermithiobacillus plumbiphilus TaxID=1729899 RepID=A0ABU9D8A6_9PROT
MNASEYISHHITNWTVSLDGTNGFMSLNVDSLIMGWITAAILVFLGILAGRRLETGVPGGLQNFLETIIDFVDGVVKDSFPGRNDLVAPLAMTVFMWVFLMNIFDVFPADLIPGLAGFLGTSHFRPTATTDLNTTMGIALTIFGLVIYTNIQVKGAGFFKEFLYHPFGKYLMPFNIIMKIIEEIAKPLSLGLRLFGNMFAGELVFLLIALLPVYINFVPGVVWSGFELLVITLQAFVFMVLTVVYLAMASTEEEHH